MARQLLILFIFTAAIVSNSFPLELSRGDLVQNEFFVLPVEKEIKEPAEEEIIVDDQDNGPFRLPVLEYHNFGPEEGRWTRTPENFYSDLEWLYNNDFRPVTVDEFVNMEFSVEPGKKPVILTFDDSSEGQFRILEDGTIDPACAVGVLNRFSEEHPDWGTEATFFVLPNSFAQQQYIDDKLKYLVRTGREIGNHTFGHEDLSEIDGESIKKTIASSEMYVTEQLGSDYDVNALAYPLGHYPDGELFELVKQGEYEEYDYKIDAAFLVGSDPAFMPDNPDFNAYKIPRIQAFDDEWKRWFMREPGQTEKSEKELDFKPYKVDELHSTGVNKTPDLTFNAAAETSEAEEQSEPLESEEQQKSAEPEFPYQTCQPFEINPDPVTGKLWKALKYKLSKIQINRVPDDLEYINGEFVYKIPEDEGENVSVSKKFFKYSRHYRVSEFRNAILNLNPDKDFLPGDEIIIPDIPLLLVKDKIEAENPWGIYLTGYYAVSDEGKRLIEMLKQRGGNLVVFDVKEIDGYVFYPSEVPLVKETGADGHVVIPDLENYVRYWHEKGVYLAARIVIFKDINLANSRPDLAIQNKSGGLWENREGVVWVDPSNIETQNYILGLTEELAKAGVDEIQFDYIRFPTLGPVENAKYSFDEENMEKYEVIRNFIARVDDRLKPYESKLSLDVYGVIAWNEGYDAISTGQRMECLGPFIDVVYPMIYPSHFGPGFGGFDNPGDHPYFFVDESIKLFKEYLEGTDTVIRPWLQAFSWRVSNYGQWYIDEQVKAAHDNGIYGYALWNASNNYF